MARIPANRVDLYFHDVYVSFPKSGVILVLVMPLVVATIRRLRTH